MLVSGGVSWIWWLGAGVGGVGVGWFGGALRGMSSIGSDGIVGGVELGGHLLVS